MSQKYLRCFAKLVLLVTSSATGEGQELCSCLSAALMFEVVCHLEEATMSASVVLQMSI